MAAAYVKGKKMIYLDNAATTKPLPCVIQRMMGYLTDAYGNPGSVHSAGRIAKEAVEASRKMVSDFLCCNPDNIIFTSGGSESNNLAIKGVKEHLISIGKNEFISDNTEHDSVLEALRSVSVSVDRPSNVIYLNPNKDGVISPDSILSAITPNTGMVSVMYVNNETGAENPVNDIGKICKDRSILFHTDCVQAAGCHMIDVEKIGCDFASISSHKIHGPKGVGALYVRDKSIISSIISGGYDQEYGIRAGTENVPGIVGFGIACRCAMETLNENDIHMSTLKQFFYEELMKNLGECAKYAHINGPKIVEHGKTINIRFDGVDAQTLVILMDVKGVCISTGSACRSHESTASRTLVSMGISPDDARESVRVSFSKLNTLEDISNAAKVMSECVKILRKNLPQQ